VAAGSIGDKNQPMDLPPGGRQIDAADLDLLWVPWTPLDVAERLAGVSAPWCVAAGWALDLHLGETPRDHDDIEIAVPRTLFGEVATALPGFEWDVAGSGKVWPYAEAGDHPDLHQTWCRDPRTGHYCLDVFREPHDGNRWICRRDPTITMPYDELIRSTHAGIPYLIPEVVLLFKARRPRDKDDDDFRRVAPHLTTKGRARLAEWLRRLYPDHSWLSALNG
jgi:hypothetical protein